MMDSTTITLFDNILKGVGRHPKSGKKKGGMKVQPTIYIDGIKQEGALTAVGELLIGPDATADLARPKGVYNLQGQRMGESIDGLPAGVYIVDGVKRVVK